MAQVPALTVRYGNIDLEYARRLTTTAPEDDGPVWMVNLMKYRGVADYGDSGGPVVSGRAADDAYAPLESLAAVGAEIVFLADVDTQLLGDSPNWDRVAVVKYPTRRSFVEMQSRPEFVEKHVHKDAGMEQTIVMGCQPMATPELPADAPGPAEKPHPATNEDGPVVVLHILRFAEGHGISEMTSYQEAAGRAAIPHGVRISAWFAVEGTIVGDGRSWDQARFNAFPSKAAFLAVVPDPTRLRAQRNHREKAIEDTYAIILRPSIDRLAESTGSANAR